MTAPAAFDEELWAEVQAAFDQIDADAVHSHVPGDIVHAMRSPNAATVDMPIDGVPTSVPIPAGRLTPNEIVVAWQDLRAAIVAGRQGALS